MSVLGQRLCDTFMKELRAVGKWVMPVNPLMVSGYPTTEDPRRPTFLPPSSVCVDVCNSNSVFFSSASTCWPSFNPQESAERGCACISNLSQTNKRRFSLLSYSVSLWAASEIELPRWCRKRQLIHTCRTADACQTGLVGWQGGRWVKIKAEWCSGIFFFPLLALKPCCFPAACWYSERGQLEFRASDDSSQHMTLFKVTKGHKQLIQNVEQLGRLERGFNEHQCAGPKCLQMCLCVCVCERAGCVYLITQ